MENKWILFGLICSGIAQRPDEGIKTIKTDDLDYLVDEFPDQEPAKVLDYNGNWFAMMKDAIRENEILELKPNLFGLGVELNNALDAFGNRLEKAPNATQFGNTLSDDTQ